MKKHLKLLLKISISAAALYIVYRKIDVNETLKIISSGNIGWLLLSLIGYLFSKLISSYRLNEFFRAIGLNLPTWQNIKLYAIGMFYNIFLPGGIGGDGYKVYLLNKHYKSPVKSLVGSVLFDRISGVVSLGFLALVFFLFSSAIGSYAFLLPLTIAGIVIAFPVHYGIIWKIFPSFRKVFIKTTGQSLLVQGVQLLTALAILTGISATGNYYDYLTLFLVSSVVAVLPITIGGVGARELVFVYGYELLVIDKNQAVAFSLVFFVITAISSLTGMFFSFRKEDAEEPPSEENIE